MNSIGVLKNISKKPNEPENEAPVPTKSVEEIASSTGDYTTTLQAGMVLGLYLFVGSNIQVMGI